MEKIAFATSDGVTIIGDYQAVPSAKKAILMLHMMPATKESYAPLQEEFAKAGAASLAIDLRGHGESVKSQQGTLNYQKFQDADHQNSRLDADAALTWLAGKGFLKSTISVIGASIGANLSMDLLAREPSIPRAVLLSPGLNYRGVITDEPARKISLSQKILFVAAEGDSYSADSVRTLTQILGNQKSELVIYQGSGHGTGMWQSYPELIQKIVAFL